MAKPGRSVGQTSKVSRRTLQALGNTKALPFLSGNQKLTGAMGWVGGGCGLRAALQLESPPVQQPDPTVFEEPKPEKPRPQKQIREQGRDKHDRGVKHDRGGDKHDQGRDKQDQGGGGNDTGRDPSDQGSGNQTGGNQNGGNLSGGQNGGNGRDSGNSRGGDRGRGNGG